MNEFEVTCIHKPNRMSAHEHITHIGNIANNWQMAREEAFYTIDRVTSRRVYIGVVRGDGMKAPYLRTHADRKWQDNLLALNECNGTCKLIV